MLIRLTMIIIGIVSETVAKVCDEKTQLSVELLNRTYNGIEYNEREYFVDSVTGIERGCICLKAVCTRKCCPFGQAYNNVTESCFNTTTNFVVPVLDTVLNTENKREMQYYYKIGMVQSKIAQIQLEPVSDILQLNTDGSLKIQNKNTSKSSLNIEAEYYCIETLFVGENDTDPKLYVFIWNKTVVKDWLERKLSLVLKICLLISCFFKFVTVVVYSCLPKLRNLHGLAMMACLITTFVYFIHELILYFVYDFRIYDLVNLECRIGYGATVHYFFSLAIFFWCNILCYDAWRHISKQDQSSEDPQTPRPLFYFYCLYAFGVPIILTALWAGLKDSGQSKLQTQVPESNNERCLYYKSNTIYIQVPILILCMLNLILITITRLKIKKNSKVTEDTQTDINNTSDKHEKCHQRFKLFNILFAVIGFGWIFKMVCELFLLYEAKYFVFCVYCYNHLIGLFIFVAFSWEKNILVDIKERYKEIKGRSESKEARAEIRTILRNYIKTQMLFEQGQDNKAFEDQQTPIPKI